MGVRPPSHNKFTPVQAAEELLSSEQIHTVKFEWELSEGEEQQPAVACNAGNDRPKAKTDLISVERK